MKSQQSEQIVKTSCKDCRFAVYEDDTQTSCYDEDRLQSFKDQQDVEEAYDNEKEFYVINRLCNIYRVEAKNSIEEDFEKAKRDISLTYKILLDCSFITEEDDVDKIANYFNYDRDKYEIVILQGKKTNNATWKIFELSKALNCDITKYFDYNFTIHQQLEKCPYSYHAILNIRDLPDPDTLKNINLLINQKMEKAVVVNVKGVEFMSNLAYKIYSFRDECNSYTVNAQNISHDSQKKKLYRCL